MSQHRKPKVLLFDIGGVCAIIDYEVSNNIPKGYINYAISASKPNGSWHQAERGELPLDAKWFRAFKTDIENPTVWARFHKDKLGRASTPPRPNADAEKLYWTMMSTARASDPNMAPALKKLKASNQYHLCALSNTTIFPDGHEFNKIEDDDVRLNFEIFVSSAHVGMRKPNRDIYEYTMKAIRDKWPSENIGVEDVVFLDDIGENLKMGKEMGWRTIKVLLGHTDKAVRELEGITGLQLLDPSGEKMAKL